MSWRNYADEQTKKKLKEQEKTQSPIVSTNKTSNAVNVQQMKNQQQFNNRVKELTEQNLQTQNLQMNTSPSLASVKKQDTTINKNSNMLLEAAKTPTKKESYNGFAEDYGGVSGNIDLNNRKVKYNEDGRISTENSIGISVEVDGKRLEFVIPTVIDGKQVSDEEAEKHFYETGEYLGAFDNVESANAYGEALHERQDEYYTNGKIREIKNQTEPIKKITKTEALKSRINSSKVGDVARGIEYLSEEAGHGVASTLGNIGKGHLLERARQAIKGSDKSIGQTFLEYAESVSNVANPAGFIMNMSKTIANYFDKNSEERKKLDKIWNNDSKSVFDKIIATSQSGMLESKDMIPIIDMYNKSVQLRGSIDREYGSKTLKELDDFSKPFDFLDEGIKQERAKQSETMQGIGSAVNSSFGSLTTGTIGTATGTGYLPLYLSSSGGKAYELYKQGYDLETIAEVSNRVGTIETAFEAASGGLNVFGRGSLDDITDGIIKNKASKISGREAQRAYVTVMNKIFGNVGEIGEEVGTDYVNMLFDRATIDPNAEYTVEDFKQTVFQTILSTELSNTVTTLSGGDSGANELYSDVVKNELKKSIDSATDLTTEEKNSLKKYVEDYDITKQNNIDSDLQTQKEDIQKAKSKNEEKVVEKTKPEEKQSTTIENKPILENEQQITQTEQKNAETKNIEEIQQDEKKTEQKELNQKQRKDVANFTAQYSLEHDNFSGEASQNLQSYAYENNITAEELSKMSDKKIREISGAPIQNENEETKRETIKSEQSKGLLIKPKGEDSGKAKKILEKITKGTERERAKEQKNKEEIKKLTDAIFDYVVDNNINREQIKHIKKNAIDKALSVEDFKNLTAEQKEKLMDENVQKYNEQNAVKEEKHRPAKWEKEREAEYKEYTTLLDKSQHVELSAQEKNRMSKLEEKISDRLSIIDENKNTEVKEEKRSTLPEKIESKLSKSQKDAVSRIVSEFGATRRLNQEQSELLLKYAYRNNIEAPELRKMDTSEMYKAIKSERAKLNSEVKTTRFDNGVTNSDDYKALQKEKRAKAEKNKLLDVDNTTFVRETEKQIQDEEAERNRRYKKLDELENNESNYNGFDDNTDVNYSREQKITFVKNFLDNLDDSENARYGRKRFNREFNKNFLDTKDENGKLLEKYSFDDVYKFITEYYIPKTDEEKRKRADIREIKNKYNEYRDKTGKSVKSLLLNQDEETKRLIAEQDEKIKANKNEKDKRNESLIEKEKTLDEKGIQLEEDIDENKTTKEVVEEVKQERKEERNKLVIDEEQQEMEDEILGDIDFINELLNDPDFMSESKADNEILSDADYTSENEYNNEVLSEEELNETLNPDQALAKRLNISENVVNRARTHVGFDKEQYKELKKNNEAYLYKRPSYEEAVDKGINYGERILESLQGTDYITDEMLYNKDYEKDIQKTIEDKQKILDDMGVLNVISTVKGFSKANGTANRGSGKLKPNITRAQETYNYIKYLDEKLKKALYNDVGVKYDRPSEFDSATIHSSETIAQLNKKQRNLRKELINKNLKDINIFDLKNVQKGLKSLRASSLALSTPIRVNEKVFGQKMGKVVNDATIRPLQKHLADIVRINNATYKEIDDNFGIKEGSEDAKVLFKLIEGKEYDKEGNTIRNYDKAQALKDLNGDSKRLGTILNAQKRARQMFNNRFNELNVLLEEHGFPKIEYRENYITHYNEFNDAVSEYMARLTSKEASQQNNSDYLLGIAREISENHNDLIGFEGVETERTSLPSAQQRHTNITGNDAITAIKSYMRNTTNVLCLTEDIQTLRAFEQLLRQYSMQEDITEDTDLIGIKSLTKEQMQKRLESKGTFNDYINWLDEYVNILSGKESDVDQSVRKYTGNLLDGVDIIRDRVSSNLVGLNQKTPFTNFISSSIAAAQTRADSDMRAIAQMISRVINKSDDGTLAKSDTWARRQGENWVASKTGYGKFKDNVRKVGSFQMNLSDRIATEFIIRAKYDEGLHKFKERFTDKNGNVDYDGLSDYSMQIADDFASRVLAERSRGMKPNAFNTKALGLLTDFQLEVNNQIDVFTHDLAERSYREQTEYGKSKLAANSLMAANVIELAIMENMFNNIYEATLGGRPAFDIIQVIKTALGYDKDDDDEDEDKNPAVKMFEQIFGLNYHKNDKKVSENVSDATQEFITMLPFFNAFSSNARVPVASVGESVIGDIKDTGKAALDYATAETPEEKQEAEKALKERAKGTAGTLIFNVVLPTGGTQAKRTFDTIKTYKEGANYREDGRMRYPVQDKDKKPVRVAQALLFGRSNMPSYKEYQNDDYRTITVDQAKVYNKLENVDFKDYKKIIDSPKKEDKIKTINSMNLNSSDKWELYKEYVISDKQLENAKELIDSGLTTKTEYIKNYNKINKNENISIPNAEQVDKMIEHDVQFDTWLKYQEDLSKLKESRKPKEVPKLLQSVVEQEEAERIDQSDKAKILLNKKYSTEEREKLFLSVTGSKANIKKYNTLKGLGKGDSKYINTYLQYMTKEFTADKKQGKYDNKNSYVKNSKQEKIQQFIDTSDWTPAQKAYIKVTNSFPSITNYERELLDSYANRLSNEEYNEFYDSINQKFVGINYSKKGKNEVVWFNKYIK